MIPGQRYRLDLSNPESRDLQRRSPETKTWLCTKTFMPKMLGMHGNVPDGLAYICTAVEGSRPWHSWYLARNMVLPLVEDVWVDLNQVATQ